MAIHAAQCHPAIVQVKAFAYLDVIMSLLLDDTQDLDYILNMDHTPVYHVLNYKSTIDQKGVQTINYQSVHICH